MDLNTFSHFLRTAGRGARVTYHSGFLSRDRGSRAADLNAVADAAYEACSDGRVHLIQRRTAKPDRPEQCGSFDYIAVIA